MAHWIGDKEDLSYNGAVKEVLGPDVLALFTLVGVSYLGIDSYIKLKTAYHMHEHFSMAVLGLIKEFNERRRTRGWRERTGGKGGRRT